MIYENDHDPKKKILIIGSGGREHALAWRLRKEGAEIFVTPGNAGLFEDGFKDANIDSEIFDLVVSFTKSKKIDLVIIGPEKPLVLGLGNRLRKEGILVIGPNKDAAQLEASKSFAKKIMHQAGIPSAPFRAFSDYNDARVYLDELYRNTDEDSPVVIKADGLAGGKGVVLPSNLDEAQTFLRQFMQEGLFGESSKRIVIEERLEGNELSFICLCSSEHFISLPTSRDYKRLKNGDLGPNTGGMGARVPSPDEKEETRTWIEETVLRPLFRELKKEGITYTGFLYVGLMLTQSGMKVLEFNVRLGDPETQALMVGIEEKLLPYLFLCAKGQIKKDVQLTTKETACLVLTSQYYGEGEVRKGDVIVGLENVDSKMFFAGVKKEKGLFYTEGGRVLSICSTGEGCMDRCLEEAKKISWKGMHYRTDL